MLGYRTLFTADQAVVGRSLMDEGRAQIHSWLRSTPRNFDTDLIGDGITNFPGGARCMLIRREGQDGSETLRFRLSEEKPNGLWTTRLTIRSEPSERSWVLVEVEDPTTRDEGFGKRQRVDPPGLARNLFDSIDAEDGPVMLRAKPSRFSGDRLGEVLDWVESTQRRGLLILGAQSDRAVEPDWEETLNLAAKVSAGQASVVIIPPEMVTEWNEVVTKQRLPWGGLRVFYPGTILDEPAHGQRNLFYSRERLQQKGPGTVSRRIGWLARELATRTPLPAAARRVERVMDDFENETTLSTWTLKSRERREAISQAASSAIQEQHNLIDETSVSSPIQPTELWSADDQTSARELLRGVVGDGWTLKQSIEYLLLFEEDSRQQVKTSQTYSNMLSMQIADLKEELAIAELEREIAGDEAATAEARLLEAQDRIRYLEQELVKHAQYDIAYGIVPEELKTKIPDDFDGVLEELKTMNFVKFVGDAQRTQELNELSGITSAVFKAYTALLALEDYARGKKSGDFQGNVSTYLKNTPHGYRSWYANRHAEFESADVGNQERFRRPRTFRVEELGKDIYMEAHFKITQEDLRSPRLHYFDATAETGLIYVGYLGPHLPTKQTN